jgi:serine/threonine protein kinase/HAMP domain-containing protein
MPQTPIPESSAADVPAPAERLRALETVAKLERQLRRNRDQALAQLKQRLDQQTSQPSGPPPCTSQATATRSGCEFDPDATRIAPRTEPAHSASITLPPGFRLHEYRIDSVLGQGGFGITYLATDINLNTRFAIKEYLPTDFATRNPDFSVMSRHPDDHTLYQTGLDSFLTEARILASFRHPNIVRVARFFEAHHTAYMVLEYERGQSLKQWWPAQQAGRGLTEIQWLARLQPLLDGLAEVHASGYLHRDIKPDNIMVRSSDGSLVLLDFGAAHQTAGGQHALAAVLTPGYAPPEQYQSHGQGPFTDLYAFAATLYWVVNGQKPLAAPLRMQQTIVSAQELGRGRFSTPFLQAIDAALQLDPAARPQSVAEFADTLCAAHSTSLGLGAALRIGHAAAAPRLALRSRAARLWHALSRPASWPLGLKMSLALVLAALLPMLATAWYNYDGSIAALSGSELRNLERLAASSAGRVGQLLQDSAHLANYLDDDADFHAFLQKQEPGLRSVIEHKISHLLAANPDIHRLVLLDRQGTALVSNDPAVTGSNNRFRDYFQRAIQGQAVITGMVVSHIDGTSGVYYANPVFDAEKQVQGVIVLRIKAATISRILSESNANSGRTPFLIDGDGVLIAHPDSRQLYRSLAPLSKAQRARIVADRRFGQAAVTSLDMPDLARVMVGASRPGQLSFFSRISASAEHAGYAPVPGHNWVVGLSEGRALFEAPLKHLLQQVLQSVLLVGAIFVLLAIWFARSIVRPIARMTEAANALTQGDFEQATIPVERDDEIGRLARTFNVLIDVLRQRERERRRSKRQG